MINIATMSTVSDISDWTFNEVGLTFKYYSPDSNEMKQMYEKSPLQFVKNVQVYIIFI